MTQELNSVIPLGDDEDGSVSWDGEVWDSPEI
jgi:hypothetical protein